MRLADRDLTARDRTDLTGKRLLIFIVAYNAETTIEKVLGRIPASLHSENVEVLIIDDFSKDNTFSKGLWFQQRNSAFKITVLRTPVKSGLRRQSKARLQVRNRSGFRHCRASPWRWSVRSGRIARLD